MPAALAALIPGLGSALSNPAHFIQKMFQGCLVTGTTAFVALCLFGKYLHDNPSYVPLANWMQVDTSPAQAPNATKGDAISSANSKLGPHETIGSIVAKSDWPRDQWPEVMAVIYRESGGRADAAPWTMSTYNKDVNYYRGDPSIGLMQIVGSNVVNLHQASSLKEAQQKLMDPLFNVNFAHTLWKMYGWGPWTTSKGWQPYQGHANTPITGYKPG